MESALIAMMVAAGFLTTANAQVVAPDYMEVVHQVSVLAEKYNQSPSLALRIIYCEGGVQWHIDKPNNQNKKNGEVWSNDIGYWQINDHFHRLRAMKEGYDIYDPMENLEYGFKLLKRNGTQPWNASKACWNKPIE
jgi:hypothetical protein